MSKPCKPGYGGAFDGSSSGCTDPCDSYTECVADTNSACTVEASGAICRCNDNFGINVANGLCESCTEDCSAVTGQFCVIKADSTQECQCDSDYEVNDDGDACVEVEDGAHSVRGFAWAIMTLPLLVLLVK